MSLLCIAPSAACGLSQSVPTPESPERGPESSGLESRCPDHGPDCRKEKC